MKSRRVVKLAIAFAAVFAAGWAHTQENSPTQAELLEIIKQMQQQIADLEKTVKALQDRPAPALETPRQSAAPPVEQESVDPNDFRVYWKDGLRMDTQDGNFKLRIGGRIQADWGWFDDGNELRAKYTPRKGWQTLRKDLKTAWGLPVWTLPVFERKR